MEVGVSLGGKGWLSVVAGGRGGKGVADHFCLLYVLEALLV